MTLLASPLLHLTATCVSIQLTRELSVLLEPLQLSQRQSPQSPQVALGWSLSSSSIMSLCCACDNES